MTVIYAHIILCIVFHYFFVQIRFYSDAVEFGVKLDEIKVVFIFVCVFFILPREKIET